jgi:peptidoglycan/xylan/chitin deacetylase (PgdA/CDA1 family)
MKKKICIAAVCAAVLLLLLAACRSEASAPETYAEVTPLPTKAPTASPTPEPTPYQEEEMIILTPEPTPTVTLPPAPTPDPTPTPTPAPTEVPNGDPIITLVEGEELNVAADFTFSDPGYFAADYRGNSLTDRVTVKGEVVPYLTGTYELSYSVKDDDGRSTTVVRRVHIVPAEMPEIVMPPEKTVYLTFDDGPCGYTEKLLDVLKKYDAKATFFVIGNKARTDLIKREYEEGHAIGVHSYTHEYKSIYASEQAFFDDFLKTQEVIKEQTGSYTRIFRFPGGSGNTASRRNKGIMTRLTKIMEDMGYRYFDWNVTAGDSGTGYTETDVKNRVTRGMRVHSDFAIVLQHDIHPISVRAVESILKWGKENGYTFLPLDLTSPVVHSTIKN